MKNFVQPGNTLDLTAPSGGVDAGNGYLIGALFGVAAVTAAEGESFAFDVVGVFTLPKASGAALAEGAKAYWDSTAKNVTGTASGNTLIGHVTAAAKTGDAQVSVRLAP